jgi:hypothetical protein
MPPSLFMLRIPQFLQPLERLTPTLHTPQAEPLVPALASTRYGYPGAGCLLLAG